MTTMELGIMSLDRFWWRPTQLRFDEFYFLASGKQMTMVELGVHEIPKQRHFFDLTGIFFGYLEGKGWKRKNRRKKNGEKGKERNRIGVIGILYMIEVTMKDLLNRYYLLMYLLQSLDSSLEQIIHFFKVQSSISWSASSFIVRFRIHGFPDIL